jgi:hypothetical protein
MSQSIRTDTAVHCENAPLDVECQDLTTAAGRLFRVLRIGPIAFYPGRDQLRLIRDAIDGYLGEPDDAPAPFVPSEQDWEDAHRIFDDRQVSADELAMIASHDCV